MTTVTDGPSTIEQQPDVAGRRLTAAEIRALDPHQLMAELGTTAEDGVADPEDAARDAVSGLRRSRRDQSMNAHGYPEGRRSG